jgi:hypothetical protein
MHVETRTHTFSLTDGLQGFLRRRIEFALGRYRDAIRRVVVRLRGRPGGRPGAASECLLEVELASRSRLVISDADPDLYRAIARATRRADQQIARRLARRPPRQALPHLV